MIIGANVWDTLVYRDPVTNEYKGQLAKSWKQIDDKTIEFELREGVKFHNGEEFDADDVVYTLNFISKPENKVVTQGNVNWIEKAEKLDKYKVRLTTKEIFPAAIEYLAGPVVIHPNEYYEKVGPKGQNEKPVGSGPYKVSNYVPGKSITLELNKDYFKDSPKPQPKIGKIDIRFIPDRQTQMAEMLSGGGDLIMHVPKDQADQLKTVPTLQVVSGETMRIVFMQMNIQDGTPAPALKDERVRKAIIHAIDREAMVKNIVGDGSRVINTICFPSQFGCTDEGATRYNYDPAKAKALLAKAGFPNGFSMSLETSGASPYHEVSQSLQSTFAQGGIKVELRMGEPSQVLTRYRERRHDALVFVWAPDYSDPSSTLEFFSRNTDDSDKASNKNAPWRAHWLTPELTAEADKASHEVDDGKRMKIYADIQRKLRDESPFTFLIQKLEPIAMRSNVHNYSGAVTFDSTPYWVIEKR